ncbi:MAG: Asp-tRNA(Asn)/Glu-tRNA(Gln) amidotransferase subunit GatC [Candidatus Micrarchaeales archaeon]|nr:Asp-tRNA(Asn)/Glu-tRNA(Gln) amidotransferase subunit GatC [Candidatus Micrarchaeales archaeon]
MDYWKIDKELINRIALISKLDLNESERMLFLKQLGDVLDTFKLIDEVDTDGLEPAFHPRIIENIWREDEASETAWDPLADVESKEEGYYKAPRIV